MSKINKKFTILKLILIFYQCPKTMFRGSLQKFQGKTDTYLENVLESVKRQKVEQVRFEKVLFIKFILVLNLLQKIIL